MSDAVHFVNALKQCCDLETHWTGKACCGTHLKWNYVVEPWADLSMPGRVEQKLAEFEHDKPERPQHAPCPSPSPSFGRTAQEPPPEDATPLLDADGTKRVQKIVGSFLFCGQGIDMTTSKGLNSLSCQQSKPTTHTKKKCDQSFDCLVTHPDANISFYALDVMPCIYSDASHMNEPGAKSTAGGHCFVSSAPKNGQATKLNGAICSSCTELKLVAASTA